MAEDYGIKYALPGKKANGNKNPKELGFSSQFNTLKTFKKGNPSFVAPNGISTWEIAHGLGYRPAFNAYYRDSFNGEIYQVSSFNQNGSGREGASITCEAKSNNYNLVIRIHNQSGLTKNIDFFFEIFYENLTTEPIYFIG